jgi:hypothetical protein
MHSLMLEGGGVQTVTTPLSLGVLLLSCVFEYKNVTEST